MIHMHIPMQSLAGLRRNFRLHWLIFALQVTADIFDHSLTPASHCGYSFASALFMGVPEWHPSPNHRSLPGPG